MGHDVNKYLNMVKKKQMKKKRLDVNEPLNVKLEKFKQHLYQPLKETKGRKPTTVRAN